MYTVSSGNSPSFSRATNSSLLMLTAGLRGQFPRWRLSTKRLSECSVLRCPDLWLQCSVSFVHGLEKTHHAWCVFSEPRRRRRRKRRSFKLLKERVRPYTELKLPSTRFAGKARQQDRFSIKPPFKSATASSLCMPTYSILINFPSRIFHLP